MTGIPYLDRVEQDLMRATARTKRRRPSRLVGFAAGFAVTVAAFVGVLFLGGDDGVPFGARELAPGTPLDADLVVFIDPDTPATADVVRQVLSNDASIRTFVLFDQDAAFLEFQELFADRGLADMVDRDVLPLSFRVATDSGPGTSLIAELESIDGVTAVRAKPVAGECEVTVPSVPGFVPPDTHPETPAGGGDMVWYGSDDLWTALATDGTHGPRKSVWWSANFPGGAVEERPDITVTYEKLDAPFVPTITVGGPGTNAGTSDGWFMIAGGEPHEPGCWKATANYKGATLSYTYLVEG